MLSAEPALCHLQNRRLARTGLPWAREEPARPAGSRGMVAGKDRKSQTQGLQPRALSNVPWLIRPDAIAEEEAVPGWLRGSKGLTGLLFNQNTSSEGSTVFKTACRDWSHARHSPCFTRTISPSSPSCWKPVPVHTTGHHRSRQKASPCGASNPGTLQISHQIVGYGYHGRAMPLCHRQNPVAKVPAEGST